MGRVFIVAIDGRSGSGKSTLAGKIAGLFKNVQIIEMDYFYDPESKTADFHYDWTRIAEVLKTLRQRKKAMYKRSFWDVSPKKYDGKIHEVLPLGIIIIEGTTSLRRQLRKYYDYTIWLEMDKQKSLKLAVTREVARQKNKTKLELGKEWTHDIQSFEDRYIKDHKPQQVADSITIPIR